ncbi:GNAT family N-acetyltransferase [Emticicia sp. CRIBPO]|uniref:GNAT family N-acetyltransferase n=1 Tax=Emticicia sp. CRIBPO TaxID=2683258 RepID=UPI001412D94B|nr:GNAT family N-acetyltransferase [Emticicia sp. CRIBPO]NBA84229.1 GNAT family N-acetyltransferase [Emticicia sp. CRIBPO]
MDIDQYSKLDNPVWYALNETHQAFSRGSGDIRAYVSDVAPFVGFENQNGPADLDDGYIADLDSFFIVGTKPLLPGHIWAELELKCLQMVCLNPVEMEISEEIVPLTERHNQELVDLVNLVQPGLFREKTRLMGQYYGIFKDGKLVSITGERIKMNDFTEVSAVITHPDYVGKGLAKQLVAHVTNNILAQGSVPYLHVLDTNERAIGLYEKLGYVSRRNITFWKVNNLMLG